MKKVVIFLLAALFFSATAFAYDDLVSGPTPPRITEKGGFGIEGNLVYLTAGDVIDVDGEKQSLDDNNTNFRIPLSASYGVIDNLDVFAILPIASIGTGGETESGIGDIWLGARYSLIPALTLRGALNLATGDNEKGLGSGGGFGIDIAASSGKWLIEDKLGVSGQLGLRWLGEDSDTKYQPGIGFYIAGGVGYMILEDTHIRAGLELLTTGDGKADGEDVEDSGTTNLDLLIGTGKLLTETIGINGNIVFTLMGKKTNADIGLRIALWKSF